MQTEAKFVATLVRGEFYSLRDHIFRPGERHVISETEMIHLEEHAVQQRTIFDPFDGSAMPDFISMFAFTPHEGPEPTGHRFPSAEELDAKHRAIASRERSRRIAIAKADIDSTLARPRMRSRA